MLARRRQSRRGASRFSLLLLDEGEVYIDDFAAECATGDLRALRVHPQTGALVLPSASGGGSAIGGGLGGGLGASAVGTAGGNVALPQRGRLRLCSHSLVFEPDDVRLPIVRLPLRAVARVSVADGAALVQQQQRTASASLRARSTTNPDQSLLQIVTDAVVLEKIGGANHPYVFRDAQDAIAQRTPADAMLVGAASPTKKPAFVYRFTLSYTTPAAVITRIQQLHSLVRVLNNEPAPEYSAVRLSDSDPEVQLENFVESLRGMVRFDRGRLEDVIYETVVLEQPTALHVTPLTANPGVLCVTNKNLYFQPFSNEQIGADPVLRWPLGRIARVARRRYVLRDVGIEIFLEPSRGYSASVSDPGRRGTLWTADSVFFAVRSAGQRDALETALLAQPEVHAQQFDDVTAVAADWCRGKLSNFDYLMYLNAAAGRTFNDLTQYPVFPWVLADYDSESVDAALEADPATENPAFRDLTKPIGALNPERLAHLVERYAHMEEANDPDNPPFLYGTHYSAPGYVLYYLVRKFPDFVLRLQNGRFDVPGRMFHSFAETWKGVNFNNADVKELIPEFYMLPADLGDDTSDADMTEFLCNRQHLDLGVKPDTKERLHDVVLPTWANGDPARFLHTMRRALESDYVSARLHDWIDLMFGYKQRGTAAKAAHNVFYHLTYEGAVDIDAVERVDKHRARAIVQQIKEFGQTPRQMFTTPHPRRGSTSAVLPASSVSLSSSQTATIESGPRSDNIVDFAPALPKVPPKSDRAFSGADLLAELGDLDTQPTYRISQPYAEERIPSSAVESAHDDSVLGRLSRSVAAESQPAPKLGGFAALLADAKASVKNVFETVTNPSPLANRTVARSEDLDATSNVRAKTESISGADSDVAPVLMRTDPKPEQTFSNVSLTLSSQAVADTTGANARVAAAAALARADWTGVEQVVPSFSAPHAGDQVSDIAVYHSATEGGSMLVSVGHAGVLRVFAVADKRQLRRVPVSADATALSSVCILPTATHAVVGCWDNSIYLVDLTGSGVSDVLRDAHQDAVSCVAVNTAGTLVLSGGWDRRARIWGISGSRFDGPAQVGVPLVEFEFEDEVTCCALDPSPATELAVVGTRDGTVAFCSVSDRRVVHSHSCLHSLAGASGTSSVAFAPSGTRVVTAGADATVRVLSVVNAGAAGGVFPILWTIPVPADGIGGVYCAVTDGSRVLAAGSGGVLRMWETAADTEGSSVSELRQMRCMGASDEGVGRIAVGQPNAHIVVCSARGSSGLIRVFSKP